MSSKEKGQTLVEVLVALTVGIVVIGALAIATIVSLRNSQFSQNQLLATKLAQEGLDLVRTLRDRDGKLSGTIGPTNLNRFSDLWSINLAKVTTPTPECDPVFKGYFYFDSVSLPSLRSAACTTLEDILPMKLFGRQVLIEDDDSVTTKKITVKVSWTDNSGKHESNLQTILGKI